MQERNRTVGKRKTFWNRGAAMVIPLICIMLLLSQTVFARNTYVITDGSHTLVHMTYATDPDAVLNEAGLELGENDTYSTAQEGGVSEITVQRSAQAGQRATVSTETYTQSIPHSTTYCDAPWLPEGTEEVLIPGEDGQMLCTASVQYKDGAEQSRTLLSQTVKQQPVEEVIARGSGTEAMAADYVSQQPIIGENTIITSTGEVLTYTRSLEVLATAYSCEENGGYGITATGTRARVGEIAVDPRVIPLGTRLFIVSNDGNFIYGVATAEDTGGLIIGNRIDLYYDTVYECGQLGARMCTVYFLSD